MAEQTWRNRRGGTDVAEQMHEIGEEEEQAFRTVVGEDQRKLERELEASTQHLLNPELSIPLPIGQKPSLVEVLPMTHVLKSKRRELWEKAMQRDWCTLGFRNFLEAKEAARGAEVSQFEMGVFA